MLLELVMKYEKDDTIQYQLKEYMMWNHFMSEYLLRMKRFWDMFLNPFKLSFFVFNIWAHSASKNPKTNLISFPVSPLYSKRKTASLLPSYEDHYHSYFKKCKIKSQELNITLRNDKFQQFTPYFLDKFPTITNIGITNDKVCLKVIPIVF